MLLAFVEHQPVGALTLLEGFSTFDCQPILNVHDAVVARPFRRMGICKAMFQTAEQLAVRLGCCKITLEVLEGNVVARDAYVSYGFAGYQLDPRMGKAMMMQKKLST